MAYGRGVKMGGNNSPNNRFPLPDDWNVDDFICMVIPVPNDEQYISQMRGLIETLIWSRSFDLHPTENAARQVADTWQRAFRSAEIKFEGCDMPEFRISDDCLLEVNCGTHDDPVWQPVFTKKHSEGGAPRPFPPDSGPYGADTARRRVSMTLFSGCPNDTRAR